MPQITRSYRTIATLLLCVAAFAFAGSRAESAGRAEDRAAAEAPTPQWPPPPAAARVRFLQQVTTASDWGVARGWWGRMVDSLTGRRETAFVRPTGTCEADGVLYVADPGAQAVFILDAPRKKAIRVTRAGDRMLVSPVAVVPASAGRVYVADSVLAQVLLFDRDGQLLRRISHADMLRPSSLAFDGARGRLYVGDSKANVVHVFDDSGARQTTLGSLGSGRAQFNSPTHLAVAPDGSLVVTDALNFRVLVLRPDGQLLRSLGRAGDGSGDFAAPKGVAVDRAGYVYVADAMFDAIQVFDEAGQLMLGFGAQGSQPGQFWLPNGLYANAQDQLFVADAYNRRIQVFHLISAPAPGPRVGQ